MSFAVIVVLAFLVGVVVSQSLKEMVASKAFETYFDAIADMCGIPKIVLSTALGAVFLAYLFWIKRDDIRGEVRGWFRQGERVLAGEAVCLVSVEQMNAINRGYRELTVSDSKAAGRVQTHVIELMNMVSGNPQSTKQREKGKKGH